MNKVCIHSIWKCIDKDHDMYNRYCIIKDIDDNPDYNGDGVIELLYADGTKTYRKVRRFIPNVTHKFIKIYTKYCYVCRFHQVFFDDYGFDGCICHHDTGDRVYHLSNCYEYVAKSKDFKGCPYFEKEDD